jgi:mannose-6-phosphate isomerase
MIYTFEPIYMEKVWGGRKLESLLRRAIPKERAIGESWELVDREESQSVTKESGKKLHELWNMPNRHEIFGTQSPSTNRFPILIKILDARENLSIQVHPSIKSAAQFRGETKNEMWYFLQSDPGAEVLVGLKRGVSKTDFIKAIENQNIPACLHNLQTKPREVMFLPSGRIHGIGPGNFILEIQQNSDSTYRIFDWNRNNSSGSPRQIQIQEALESIQFNDFEPTFVQPHGDKVLKTNTFEVKRKMFFEKEIQDFATNEKSFQFLFIAHGKFEFQKRAWETGDGCFVSANCKAFELKSLEEFGEIILVGFPN